MNINEQQYLKFFKVNELPELLEANAMYLLNVNGELKIYVTNKDGNASVSTLSEETVKTLIVSQARETLLAASGADTLVLNEAKEADARILDDAKKADKRTLEDARKYTDKALAEYAAPNELLIVDTYEDLLRLVVTDDKKTKSKFVFVKDATGDDTVNKGSATYIYNAEAVKNLNLEKFNISINGLSLNGNKQNTRRGVKAQFKEFFIDNIFFKIAEHESMDVIHNVTWDGIKDKPNSTSKEIDKAVDNTHLHNNLDVLDDLSSENGQLLYNGKKVSGDVILHSVEW